MRKDATRFQKTYSYYRQENRPTKIIDDQSLRNRDASRFQKAYSSTRQQPQLMEDFTGECLKFVSASRQAVRVGVVPQLDFENTQPFSLACWVKTSDSGSMKLLAKTTNPEFRGYELRLNNGTLNFRFDRTLTTDGISVQFGTGSLHNNKWHQVVLTYDGSKTAAGAVAYVDSILQSASVLINNAVGSAQTSASFYIGAHELSVAGGDQNQRFFNGYLDECAVYNTNISQVQVNSIYGSRTIVDLSLLGPTSNLVGYWRMGEGAIFPSIPDLGAKNDGLMLNMSQSSFRSRSE